MGKNGNNRGNGLRGSKTHLHSCLTNKGCSDAALSLLDDPHVELFHEQMEQFIIDGSRPAAAKESAVLHVKTVLEAEAQSQAQGGS